MVYFYTWLLEYTEPGTCFYHMVYFEGFDGERVDWEDAYVSDGRFGMNTVYALCVPGSVSVFQTA